MDVSWLIIDCAGMGGVTHCSQEDVRIRILPSSGYVLGDGFFIVEVVGRIEGCGDLIRKRGFGQEFVGSGQA